jgi:hypothetical protein
MRVIVFLADINKPSSFYRVLQPYSYLKNVLGKDIFIYDPKVHNEEQLRNEIKLADMVIFQSPHSESQLKLIKMLMSVKGKNIKIVADFDDDPFNVGPWNPAYGVFGTKEVSGLHLDKEQVDDMMATIGEKYKRLFQTGPDGSAIVYMWKDKHESFAWLLTDRKGESVKFDIADNLLRVERINKILQEVDLLTVPTQQLADELRKYRPQGKTAVLPNLVNFDKFLPMKEKKDGKLRIVWQGGSSHYLDLAMVKHELISFAKKHPEVEYVFQGANFPAIFHEIQDRVKWPSWHSDIDTYPLSLRELSGDIAICPLTDHAFNNGKSPLKWEEMSAMKVPCVCSPVVYGNFIEHGKTGFIARPGEWEACLEKLLDPDLREEIGQNAYDAVKSKFSLGNASMYWSALEDQVSGTVVP